MNGQQSRFSRRRAVRPGGVAGSRFASLLAVVLLAGASPLPAQVAAAADPGLARLEHELERFERLSGGVLGVAAIHLETGREVYRHRAERFPMASSYKVPIAVQLLTRVDRGEVRLDSMVAVTRRDVHPGSGTISQLYQVPGLALSVRNLMELMLLISDNSATDLTLRLAGGPDAVNARLHELDVQGVRVDRPTVALIGDWIGVTGLPADGDVPPERFRELAAAVSPEQRRAAASAFDMDPRDTATPDGMAHVLAMIWRDARAGDGEDGGGGDGGGALSATSAGLLLDIMTRSTTGGGRIKGMLPPDARVAHKTGTIGGTTNDVGIITLPDEAGHVVTVMFVKASSRPVEERERAIALAARAVYDYFLFNPGGGV